MNKIQIAERKIKTIIVRRNNAAYREAHLNASVLRIADEQVQLELAHCKTQAQCIDVALKNNMTVSNTADALVMLQLCASYDDAVKRIKRHEKHDTASRIVKRAITFNNVNKKQAESAIETA